MKILDFLQWIDTSFIPFWEIHMFSSSLVINNKEETIIVLSSVHEPFPLAEML